MNVRAAELRRQGARVGLQEQPFQVLLLLLQHPGEVVTRDELRQRLSPAAPYSPRAVSRGAAKRKLLL